MRDPEGRTQRERGAHRGRGPGKIVTAACCAPAQKTVQNQKLPVAGSERGLPLGRDNRYSNYATKAIVFQTGVLYLVRTAGFHCVPSWSYAKFTCTINCHIDLASL